MAPRRAPTIIPRKKPQQERSAQLVEAILQAAVRVLEREGATGFTTSRVAEQAGVSVGSLYQYFPNKQSILFRLQEDEWQQTGRMLDAILADARRSAPERIRAAVKAFFRSECEEAPLRRALGDAAPLYRDSAQAREHRQRGLPILRSLLEQAAPGLSARRSRFAAELFAALLSSLGKHVSESGRTAAEVDAWAAATADMFLAYLATRA